MVIISVLLLVVFELLLFSPTTLVKNTIRNTFVYSNNIYYMKNKYVLVFGIIYNITIFMSKFRWTFDN